MTASLERIERLERAEALLELTCKALDAKGQLGLLPDSAYEWYERLVEDQSKEYANRLRQREELLASAKSKLTPEELEALREAE